MRGGDRHDPVPGYQLDRPIGEGSTCIVYRARQLSTGQQVAIKILRARGRLSAVARKQLEQGLARETQLCARLRHPHIVRLLDQGQTRAHEPLAVFELVPGETLRKLLLREGALPVALATEIMGQVLDALVAAHAQGIAHRDLKPLNIMISRDGARCTATVLDFGSGVYVDAARARPAQSNELEAGTQSSTLGTPRYSAPEQLRGEAPTLSSDLYTWGLILLECLTGTPAIRGSSLGQIYEQHLRAAAIPIPARLSQHPIGELLRRVLCKDPQKRGSAAAAYHDLRGLDLQSFADRLRDEASIAAVAPANEGTQPTPPPLLHSAPPREVSPPEHSRYTRRARRSAAPQE